MSFGVPLQPNDSHKSFYGKARVFTEGNKKTLVSYNTEVAYIENGKAHVNGLYSATTTRHIKAFLLENGFKAESSKQIMADYGVKEKNKEGMEYGKPEKTNDGRLKWKEGVGDTLVGN